MWDKCISTQYALLYVNLVKEETTVRKNVNYCMIYSHSCLLKSLFVFVFVEHKKRNSKNVIAAVFNIGSVEKWVSIYILNKKKLYIKVTVRFTFTFTCMHLADAFIQSDLQCIQAIHLYCQYVCSLGIKPTTFALLTQCSTTEPQEHSWTAEINTSGSKTTKMYFVFKTNYHYMDRLSILKTVSIKSQFLT